MLDPYTARQWREVERSLIYDWPLWASLTTVAVVGLMVAGLTLLALVARA